MTLKHMSLLASGIALALAGGTAQAADDEPILIDQPMLEDKPADLPGRSAGHANRDGNRGLDADFIPPGQLPDFRGRGAGGDDDDDDGDGNGFGPGGPDDVPGQCERGRPNMNIPGPAGQAGASHTAHVDFVGVDEAGEILEGEDAPWGRMTYFWIAPTFDFVFNGHNLIVGNDEEGIEGNIVYTLAAELDSGLLCLGSAAVNDDGDVHILNSVELDSHLPFDLDPDGDDEGEDAPGVGLVLLPEGGVDCDTGETIDGAEGDVLFSVEDILYVDTDLTDDNEEDDG